jgi:RNase P/RNase MRP subunit POP5
MELKKMKETKSKYYIKGFKHGIRWMKTYMAYAIQEDPDWDNEDFEDSIKEAVKSLNAGR